MAARLRLVFQWTLATTLAVVFAHLTIEIVGAALLGYYLIFVLPFIGGVIGGLPVAVFQWVVLRRVDKGRLWIAYTVAGFFGAWVVAVILVALAFVPYKGIDGTTAFFCFAAATPIIGLAQTVALRRWTSRTRMWVAASAVGWSAFFAVEFFANKALAPVNELAGRLVSAIAGYSVSSGVGATLLGGVLAGAITGVALAYAIDTHFTFVNSRMPATPSSRP